MKGDQYFPPPQRGRFRRRTYSSPTSNQAIRTQIISGNGGAVRPRLADAEFFFNTDRKNV